MNLSVNIIELDVHDECRRGIDIDKKVNGVLKPMVEIEIIGGAEYKFLIEKIVSAVKREVNKFNKEDE